MDIKSKYGDLNNNNRALLEKVEKNASVGIFELDGSDREAWRLYGRKLEAIKKEELLDSLNKLSISITSNGIKSVNGDILNIHCGKIHISINFITRQVNIDGISFYIENLPLVIKSIDISKVSDGLLIDVNPIIGSHRKYKISNENIYILVGLISNWTFEKRVLLSKTKLDVFIPSLIPPGFLQEIE